MNGSRFETMAKSLSSGRSRRAALAALAALSVRVAEVMAKRNRNPDRRRKHRKPSSVRTAAITVGGVPVTVEIADQPAELSCGLGYRAALAPGTGMLFRYPEPAPRSFWMKGMQFCLDIIWIEDGAIQ